MNSKKIGLFIANLRKEKKMTQEDLAQFLSVDRSIISKWERGIYIPNHDFIIQICDLFHISLQEFYCGEKNTQGGLSTESFLIDAINQEKRKQRHFLFWGLIGVGLLLFFFLIYYFFHNYRSFQVSTIAGMNEQIEVHQGLVVVSHEKSYILLGRVESLQKKKIHNIRLYYFDNQIEETLFFEETPYLYVIDCKKENKCHQKFYQNLYLEVILEDGSKVNLKLQVSKNYINDKLFFKYK